MADEKDEKFDEKSMEKQEEKSTEEKGWDEKWRRDPLSAITWAVIFIYSGVVLLAANLGYLDDILPKRITIGGMTGLEDVINAWPLVFIGAGIIFLIEVVIRLLIPAYRKPVTGTIIFAIILIGIGLGDLIDWAIIWAVILIVLGVSIIFRGLGRRKDN